MTSSRHIPRALLALALTTPLQPTITSAQGGNGTPTIERLAMTGDPVPGLATETFRYFRHVQLDSQTNVLFAGVTTRTGFVARQAPRGLYLATTPGVLIPIAEIDPGDAFRSIGLPSTTFANSPADTLAFDAVIPLPASLQPAVFFVGSDRVPQPLTPVSGTPITLQSGITGAPVTGHLGSEFGGLGGIVINRSNHLIFSAALISDDDQFTITPGLFASTGPGDLRNIAFAGDPAPGFNNATFTSFGKIFLADDGTTLFSSTLAGAGIDRSNNEFLWAEKNGAFSVVLRENDPAPGFPGNNVTPFGNLIQQFVRVCGDSLIAFSGLTDRSLAYWIGSVTTKSLDRLLKYDSSPNLNDPASFTPTSAGSIAFTSVDGNSIQLDANGHVYFDAGGRFADNTSIGGLWKRDALSAEISLLVPFDLAGLSRFELLDINAAGLVTFIAENKNVKSIWSRDPNGNIQRIASVGETLGGRTVTGFANLTSHSGIAGIATKTLGDVRYSHRLDDSGSFVFLARFSDADGDNFADEGIFRATLSPRQPTAAFIWSGDVGDGLWHSSPTGPTNWNDAATGEDADRVPGSTTPGEGDSQSVTINGADVTITDTPVTLLSLNATGTLDIRRPLTLANNSSIENINLGADLTTTANLTLSGATNRWSDGTIRGPGKITLAPGTTTLTLDPANNSPLELRTELAVGGSLVYESGTLDASLGKISVLQDTTFEIRAGFIQANGTSPHLVNNGTVRKTGSGTADLDVYLKNELAGRLEIFTGDVILGGPNELEGTLLTGTATTTTVKGDELASVVENFTAEGSGSLTFSESIFLTPETTSSFDIQSPGKTIIAPDTYITGTGKLVNTGQLEFPAHARLRTVLTTSGAGVTTQLGGAIKLVSEGSAIHVLDGGHHSLEADASLVREPTGSGKVTLDGGTLSKSGNGSTSTIENEIRALGGDISATSGTLALAGRTTFSGNETRLTGAGTIAAGEIEISSGSVTAEMKNGGELILTLGAAATGGKITNRGNLSWANGTITGGTLVGDTVENGLRNAENARMVTQTPVTLVDGVIENAGGTLLFSNALALADGTLVNRQDSTLELGPLGQVSTSSNKTGKIINKSGTLKKSGAQLSEIRTDYEGDKAKIELASGALKLSNPITLRNNNEATMAAGTTLEFDTESLTVEANAKLETNGSGTLRILRNLTLEPGSQLLANEATNTVLDGSHITGTGTIDNAGNLTIEKSDAAVATPILDTVVDNDGELTIRSSLGSSSDSARIKSIGKIFLDSPSPAIQVAPPVTSLYGEVVAKADTAATIGLTNLKRLLLQATTSTISDTTLTLENGSGLTIITPDFPDTPAPAISQVMEDTIVTFHGTGSVNNLPADAGRSFWLFGDLILRDGASWSGQAFSVFQTGSLDVGPGCTMTINCLDILNNACNTPLAATLGKIRIDGTVNVSGSGTSELSSETLVNGSLSFSNFTNDSLLLLRNGASMTINGSLTSPRISIQPGVDVSGTGTINSALVQNSGKISPGNSAGTLTIVGELTQTNSGSLEIELESPAPGSGFDQLVVNGPASLGGSLRLGVADGFLLPNNATITILTATTLSGRFSSVSVGGRSGRQKLTVGYTPTSVTLTSRVASVSNFNGWRSALFTPTEQADPTISSPNADSDNDNLDALLEYALDTDPKKPNHSPLEYQFETDDNGKPTRLIATFPWAKGMTDVTWQLQISDDFNSWLPLDATTVSTADQGLIDRITVSVPIDADTSPEQSLRLEVTTAGG